MLAKRSECLIYSCYGTR